MAGGRAVGAAAREASVAACAEHTAGGAAAVTAEVEARVAAAAAMETAGEETEGVAKRAPEVEGMGWEARGLGAEEQGKGAGRGQVGAAKDWEVAETGTVAGRGWAAVERGTGVAEGWVVEGRGLGAAVEEGRGLGAAAEEGRAWAGGATVAVGTAGRVAVKGGRCRCKRTSRLCAAPSGSRRPRPGPRATRTSGSGLPAGHRTAGTGSHSRLRSRSAWGQQRYTASCREGCICTAHGQRCPVRGQNLVARSREKHGPGHTARHGIRNFTSPPVQVTNASVSAGSRCQPHQGHALRAAESVLATQYPPFHNCLCSGPAHLSPPAQPRLALTELSASLHCHHTQLYVRRHASQQSSGVSRVPA